MKQKNNGVKLSGSTGFDEYYSGLYGERWNLLKESLQADVRHYSLSYDGCEPYFLDPASICSALCLPLDNARKVLDLCAAPGGKTLVLSGNLPEDAELHSNERSPERKMRLSKVVQSSMPQNISSRVTVSCSDGATWCTKRTEVYDSILLDAPCSSERHVLNDKKYLDRWSPSRIKTISMEQWALLSSAWRLLVPGGYLLYGTCALAEKENDEVVQRLFKKFDDVILCDEAFVSETFASNLMSFAGKLTASDDSLKSLEEIFACAEKTSSGFHILPDSSEGAGPLYFSLLKKNN